jgi:hypothetical protein
VCVEGVASRHPSKNGRRQDTLVAIAQYVVYILHTELQQQ